MASPSPSYHSPLVWDSARVKSEISKRWRHCQEARTRLLEDQWARNERAVYGSNSTLTYISTSALGIPESDSPEAGTAPEMNVAYTMKNARFIHAQMSSNPPSVVMRPTSSDQEDHRKADAADRVVRHAIRKYRMQERLDLLSLNCVVYGTGVAKTVWDPSLGDITGFDEQSGSVQTEGDISVTIPNIWNIYIDPDATPVDPPKYVIERLYIDYDEACYRWPERAELLKKAKLEKPDSPYGSGSGSRNSELHVDHYNAVELLEYWETGTGSNAYLGRYCITTVDGDEIEKCRPSPFRFRGAGAVSSVEAMQEISDEEKERRIEALPEKARLPYHILTDIDVPGRVYGKSAVEYASPLQDNLQRLDSARLENLEAHTVCRMVVPETADIVDGDISNSALDLIKISGAQPPYNLNPPQLFGDVTPARTDLIQGINDVMGVNESMFGQQSREQSQAAMQYATNQGNMIRRRLFNKYVLVVESLYTAILDLARKHWTTERTIQVLGKEKALEAIDLKGTDIDGGYDVVGEYGVSLSLDPITRKQEILTMMPIFEKAGVPSRTILRMTKLSELDSIHDQLDLAGSRQQEIFDRMIALNAYIPPKPYRDHKNMIAWALEYFMTSEYENLPEDVQVLCERHIQERAQLAAQESAGQLGASPAGQAPGGPPGPTPQQPAGPVPATDGAAPLAPGAA